MQSSTTLAGRRRMVRRGCARSRRIAVERLKPFGRAEPLFRGLSVARLGLRRFDESDEAMAAPADAREPGPWSIDDPCRAFGRDRPSGHRGSLGEGRRAPGRRLPFSPAVEPGAGRKRVDTGNTRFARVLPEVREHVHERVPHLPWCSQRTTVPAIGPQGPAPRQKIVHVTGDANGHTANAARKRTFVGRFHDEVQMIALH